MELNFSQKIPSKYTCDFCHYHTSNKKDYDKHILTPKHQKNQNGNNLEIMENKNIPEHICECSKKFITYSGLWKHKQKCIKPENVQKEESEFKVLTNLVLEVVKQNQELINQNNEAHKYNQELTNKIVEISKNGICNTTITNSNNNSHNKTFNLNVFLNETCKDAMNIMDFVDSLKLQLSDLENVGRLGYVEGISNIIIKNLNALDETERPLHCTDKKRETIYIKNEC